jgi:uncharacterized protein
MPAPTNKDSNASYVVNGFDFARKALEIHGTIFVSQFSRLSEFLASDEGVLDFQLEGKVDANGLPLLDLRVQGALVLNCQRCLEPFKFKLDIATVFILVPNEASLPSEEDEQDEQDYLVADTHMQVIELIEEEVLLALPLAPKHAEIECAASDRLSELKKPSPFAVLKGLKAGKNQL